MSVSTVVCEDTYKKPRAMVYLGCQDVWVGFLLKVKASWSRHTSWWMLLTPKGSQHTSETQNSESAGQSHKSYVFQTAYWELVKSIYILNTCKLRIQLHNSTVTLMWTDFHKGNFTDHLKWIHLQFISFGHKLWERDKNDFQFMYTRGETFLQKSHLKETTKESELAMKSTWHSY